MNAALLSRESGKPAVDILEEAVHLLRTAPASAWLCYYAGSLPFAMALLYFWIDMSHSASGSSRLVSGAGILAALFVWMKFWQTQFTLKLRQSLSRSSAAAALLPAKGIALVQCAVQSTGFVLLPLAFLITLPLGWVIAFYQNAVALAGDPRARSLGGLVRQASKQAALWPRQNHLLLLILSVAALILFLNLAVALFQLPHLLKMLLGAETAFTRSGWSLFNSSFLCIVLVLTVLGVDPLLKAAYVLRCFYGDSIHSGEDLRAELAASRNLAAATRWTLLCLGFLLAAPLAASEAQAAPRNAAVDPPVLDRAIDEVLTRREFNWRLPRTPETPGEKGAFGLFIDGLAKSFRDGVNWLLHHGRRLKEWLERLWGGDPTIQQRSGAGIAWTGFIQVLVWVLVAVLAVGIAVAFFKVWRQPQPRVAQAEALPVPINLLDEDVTADQLPQERWHEMARDLVARGEYRMAVRALYLATLAHLGQRGLISISPFKSNLDYDREVQRRGRFWPEAQRAFTQSLQLFERVWYGWHPASAESVDELESNWKILQSCVPGIS